MTTVLASAPLSLSPVPRLDPRIVLILFGVGVIGTAGQLLLTTAYRFGEAGRLAVMGSFGAILGVFWDLVLWGHLPDRWTAIGGTAVIAACAALQIVRASGQKCGRVLD